MANTNTSIAAIVSSQQLPAFVRDDNPLFASFMEAYYEYLETAVSSGNNDTGSTGQGKTIQRAKKLLSYNQLDTTLTDFEKLLYEQFLQFLPYPTESRVSLSRILPKIKDFYRARGTEKSYQFLLRLLTNGEEASIVYPKNNILKVSDGKWFIQKSLRVSSTQLDGNVDSSPGTFTIYTGKEIRGSSSNTTAKVERVEQFYELGTLVNEIFLSGISNTFTGGETIVASYPDSSNSQITHILRSNIFSGIVTSVTVTVAGSGYSVGNPVAITPAAGDSGSGAVAYVSAVSTGNVSSIAVLEGGSGYRANVNPTGDDWILISGGGGSGANANVYSVNSTGAFHPNTYFLDTNTIVQIAGAFWNAAQSINQITTSNLALNTINSITANFSYSNCGPVTLVRLNSVGSGYISTPVISVIPNTVIASLGILGSLKVISGGGGYNVGERAVFTAPYGSFGFGAAANIKSTLANGAITAVQYEPVDGQITGGSGYDPTGLPIITWISNTGLAANVIVSSLLGYGATFSPATGTIGAVLSIALSSPGSGFVEPPTVSLAAYGSGTANAVAATVQGVFTYPGYFLNQDGFPSADNYLQDRDYYQNYSYVVRVKSSFKNWIQVVNDMLHPSGMKVFGEYLLADDILVVPANNGGNGYDSLTVTNPYYYGNTNVFDGSSYLWTTGMNWGGADASYALASFWFTLGNYLPNTTGVRTIFSSTAANITMPRLEISVANSGNANSGTGHYLRVLASNTNDLVFLDTKTNEIANPLVTNVWYHAIWSADLTAGKSLIFLNNVNSSIAITMTTNTTEKFKFSGTLMNTASIGANCFGGNTFTGNIADFWFTPLSSYKDISLWSGQRSGWLSPYLGPNGVSLLPNGYGWGGSSLPVIYMRANNAAGNNNSGSSPNSFRVPTGNVVGLQPGPAHPLYV